METTGTREDAGKAQGRLPSVVPIRPQRCAALPSSGAGAAAAAHVEAAQAPPTPPPGARPLMTGGSSALITATLAPAAPGAHPPGPGAGRGLEPPLGPSAPSLRANRPGLAERRPRADPRRYVKSSGTFAPLTRLRLCNRGAPARVPPPGQWGPAEPAAAANRATRGRDRSRGARGVRRPRPPGTLLASRLSGAGSAGLAAARGSAGGGGGGWGLGPGGEASGPAGRRRPEPVLRCGNFVLQVAPCRVRVLGARRLSGRPEPGSPWGCPAREPQPSFQHQIVFLLTLVTFVSTVPLHGGPPVSGDVQDCREILGRKVPPEEQKEYLYLPACDDWHFLWDDGLDQNEKYISVADRKVAK